MEGCEIGPVTAQYWPLKSMVRTGGGESPFFYIIGWKNNEVEAK